MSFNRNKAIKLFRVKSAEAIKNQIEEIKQIAIDFAQRNATKSGMYIKAHTDLYVKHIKANLQIFVDTIFEQIGEGNTITQSDEEEIINYLRIYVKGEISQKQSSIKQVLASTGINQTAITDAQMLAISSSFHEEMNLKTDHIQHLIEKHNSDAQIKIKNKFLEEFEELEAHQNIIISFIIETHRSVPVEKRKEFFVSTCSSGTSMVNPSVPNSSLDVSTVDLKILDAAGYIKIEKHVHPSVDFSFHPTSKGIKYYEYLKQNYTGSFQQIDSEIKNYLSNSNFAVVYQIAFAKWKEAENLLWKAENQINYSTIGHLCRESIQEFIDSIILRYNLADKYQDKTHTKNRLEGIILYNKNQLGKTIPKFLTAIEDYWNNLIDIIQRQEHSGLKDGEELGFEDARRVVFHTGILLYEISRTIK
ncbi:MAG: hypothetical protein NTX65_12520 [Ignavibacteriales bacterium]|nr:hypothetical protein [Ignavibacteriales bacterium]